jgi:hypothetical protein
MPLPLWVMSAISGLIADTQGAVSIVQGIIHTMQGAFHTLQGALMQSQYLQPSFSPTSKLVLLILPVENSGQEERPKSGQRRRSML